MEEEEEEAGVGVGAQGAATRAPRRLGSTFCLAPQTHRAARGWVSIPAETGLVIVVAAVAVAAAEATKAPTVPAAEVDSGALQLRFKIGNVGVGEGVCQLSPSPAAGNNLLYALRSELAPPDTLVDPGRVDDGQGRFFLLLPLFPLFLVS